MTSSVTNPGKAFARIALALAIAAMGIYVASSDPPGGAVVGFLLMLAAVLFGVRTARSGLPTWAARTAVAVGALIAAFAAFLIHSSRIEAPLFAHAPGVPSASAAAPAPQWAAAVDRARRTDLHCVCDSPDAGRVPRRAGHESGGDLRRSESAQQPAA